MNQAFDFQDSSRSEIISCIHNLCDLTGETDVTFATIALPASIIRRAILYLRQFKTLQ